MKNKPLVKPTESELEILQVLWEKGASTVRAVNDELNLKKEVGYTTTLKLMQIMTEKGLVKRDESGKTHIYHAVVAEADTQKQLLDKFMDTVFKGSAMKLVMQALGNKTSNAEELKQIRKMLDDMEGGSK